MKAFLQHYWITILLCLLILAACSISLPEIPMEPEFDNIDKLVHLCMFLGLGLCTYFENTRYFKIPVSYQRIVWGSFLFPILFGGLIELIQEYLSLNRSGDWMDFVWDMAGAFLALAICLRANKIISRRAL